MRRDPLEGIDAIASSASGSSVPSQDSLPESDFELASGAVGKGPSQHSQERVERTTMERVAVSHAAARVRRAAPTLDVSKEEIRTLAAELEGARGPKPVRTIEELFRTRYMPLLEALSHGLEDRAAEQAVARWRASFERSYLDAFTALRVTGKRPPTPMVFDAPELAARAARINGARGVQLMLVDGLRYDLGQRVRSELGERFGTHAVCVDETMLWSALPTTTQTQLRLLTRGAQGLRDREQESEREPVVHRGRSATTLRRVRIGQRDVMKLDVVEARLREAGAGYEERFAAVGVEVASAITRFAEGLPPRTLLFVFGDHGFRLPIEDADATGPMSQGGSSPEEVLVPATAWLIGAMH
jgi:hypothetical protein